MTEERDADPDEYLDDWDADDAGDEPPCHVAGCRRPGVVILFRGRTEDDPQMTMCRYCSVHLTAFFDLSGGTIRVRPGVDPAAALPPAPPEPN